MKKTEEILEKRLLPLDNSWTIEGGDKRQFGINPYKMIMIYKMKTVLLNSVLMFCILWTLSFCEMKAGKNIESVSERFINETPVLIYIGDDTLRFVKEGGNFVARKGDFEATVKVEKLTSVDGKRWIISFRNKGNQAIDNINVDTRHALTLIHDTGDFRQGKEYV